MTTENSDLIEVGTVIEAYGIRGALKIRPFSNDPVALLATKEIWLSGIRLPQMRDFSVYKAKEHSGSVILELVGLTDREIALSFKSATVLIPRSKFPPLDDNEYYWTDLMGAEVHNQQNELIGIVNEIVDNSAQTVLIVLDEEKKQHLIPFVKSFIIEVDLESTPKKIAVDWQKDW
ncbi:ribosome maturation factor RimM [Polynucleobacter sp. SHI8]|uniref:ribosome maturation factor RimM n=1 Tax=unclassified Polynucleobacter TaxID=2640945 RepID=UPI00248FD3E7|nr:MULTISPECIES: ribosome maturation factor RimM [unclassified Polynucleobacter]BDW11396.1 ribosome maturation factor RimM [Polynucleobacter sp. SHI2]BDW13843.1 ribosome maturation factor RimM [Polynucleobacter sp. SHI8]